jgi:adenine-specific DNA-methyltransferase
MIDEVYDKLSAFRDSLRNEYAIDRTEASRFTYYVFLKMISVRNDLDISEYEYRSDIDDTSIDLPDHINLYEEIESDPMVLDRIYSMIISDEDYLKSQGQFFTPFNIANFMTSLDCIESPNSILEPACGPGSFLDAINNDIKTSNIDAVEKDPLLLYAAEVRSSVNGYEECVDFQCEDFIKSYDNNEKYDLIIGNPPYNKFQDYENSIGDVLDIDSKYDLGKLANLYGLFFAKSSQMIRDGGSIVLLTPSEYLHTDYGKTLKQLFKDMFHINKIIKIDSDKSEFEAMTTLCITVLKKEKSENKNVEFYVENSEGESLSLSEITLTESIPQSDISPEDKWNQYFQKINHREYLEKTVPLNSIAETKRGIATGYNNYFTFTEGEIEEWDIDNRYLKPVLTNSKDAKNYIFRDEDFDAVKSNDRKSYLLYYQGGEVSKELSEYIKYGEEIDANDRYLTRNRDPWYSMEERDPAPILATVFSRDDMRFIHNDKKVLNLAAFHGIYPERNDKEWIKAFIAYLNSDIALELAKTQHREYADGLSKFEPGDLSEIPVIDLRKLDDDKIKQLSKISEKLDHHRRRESKDESDIRKQLNSMIVDLFESL